MPSNFTLRCLQFCQIYPINCLFNIFPNEVQKYKNGGQVVAYGDRNKSSTKAQNERIHKRKIHFGKTLCNLPKRTDKLHYLRYEFHKFEVNRCMICVSFCHVKVFFFEIRNML